MTKIIPTTETIRRFNITSNIVIDNSKYKNVTEEQIKGAIERLFESSFSKADASILIEANVTDIEEEVL